MKRIKKVVSILLAMAMVFAMSLTAFASSVEDVREDEGEFSITLNNDQTGHTYSAYQVFKGDLKIEGEQKTLSNIKWGDGVNTEGLIADLKKISGFEGLADNASAADVAKLLEGVQNDAATAQEFADVIGDHLTAAAEATCKENKDADGKTVSYTIAPLVVGYYLVQDTGTVNENDAKTRYILEVVGDVETNVKTEIPTIEKKIKEGNESVDANKAGVGQNVSFEITGAVPNYTGYEKYFYVINDTLSKGLTFNNDVKVTVGEGDDLVELEEGASVGGYYLYTTENTDGTTTFQVAFKNIKDYQTGKKITVTYSATVNDNAVIGSTGNPNEVTLTYSNDPNSDENGENPDKPGTPDEKVPTGETPKDQTITYVAEIDINKYANDTNTPLEGAEFTLTGTSKQTVLATRTYYEVSETGTYYLLKNGTYTTDEPQKEVQDENGNVTTESNEASYVSTTIKYEKKTVSETTVVETPVKMVAVSDAKGKIKFKGLGAGIYTIEETFVPAGYNKADNMTVVINCEVPNEVINGTETATWSKVVTVDGVTTESSEGVSLDETSAIYSMDIINQSGSLLPSTGGIGTTIFYVVGGILVIGAGILLVTKRRMKAQ